MYQIIQLDPTDDIVAIRAKLESAELAHVVVVVPRHCGALENEPGLRLLRRAAEDLNTEIALVAHDEFVRDHAAQFGFPIFNSIAQAQSGRWRMQPLAREGLRRTQSPVSAPAARSSTSAAGLVKEWRGTILVLVLAFLGLGIAAFFFVPSAQVYLVPSAVALTTTTDILIDSSVAQVNAAARSIPARRLNREVSGTLQIRTTITRTIPDARSTGAVTFTNQRAEETLVPPGTIVKTSAGIPIRFTTTTTATVPAGGRADAPVQAVDPGPSGNVKELAINTVDGSLALSVRVINTQPTLSGNVRPVRVVTADDKKKLEDQLTKQLQAQAPAVLQAMLKPNEFVPPDSILVDLEDKQFDHAVDEPADVLSLKIAANTFGLAVDRNDLNSLVGLLLQSRLPAAHQLLPNSVTVDTLPGGKFEGLALRQPIRAVGYATQQIDPSKVASALQGKTVDEAQAFLAKNLNLAQPADLRVSPLGWLRMPWFAFRVAVFVEQPVVTRQ